MRAVYFIKSMLYVSMKKQSIRHSCPDLPFTYNSFTLSSNHGGHRATPIPGRRWGRRGGPRHVPRSPRANIDDRYGYSFMIVERQRLMEILYDQLPSKEYIKTGAGVVRIERTKRV
jgi:hypothetical protein